MRVLLQRSIASSLCLGYQELPIWVGFIAHLSRLNFLRHRPPRNPTDADLLVALPAAPWLIGGVVIHLREWLSFLLFLLARSRYLTSLPVPIVGEAGLHGFLTTFIHLADMIVQVRGQELDIAGLKT